MIIDISISNLGVISNATLPLGPGLTAVTGETGAGKTMVVSALGLLLGARADSARVRAGSSASWVEGRFSLTSSPSVVDRAEELGAVIEDQEVVLSREVQAEGRSRALIGGRSSPVSVLSELAEELVVVHGQSDQIRLRSEAAQREALDRFAGSVLRKVLENYRQSFSKYSSLAQKLEDLTSSLSQRRGEAEEIRRGLADIGEIQPKEGEDTQLRESITKLTNTEELRENIARAKESLIASESSNDRQDITTLTDAALRALERAASFDSSLDSIKSQLADVGYQVQEVSHSLSAYASGLELNGGLSLEDSHHRLAEITNLMRKYGPSLDEVLSYEKSASQKLIELEQDDNAIAELQEEVKSVHGQTLELSSQLSRLRREAASNLSNQVTGELAALAMPDATFHVSIETSENLGSDGQDSVVFELSAHPGSKPLPLGKGASGGELSRVMLALEVVIAGSHPVPTFVFDEVDAGVGGASALEIGRRLDRLAQTSQVIVVTHLAQVAAYANNHLQVLKDTDGQITTSSISALAGDDRLRELARMLGGMEDSRLALSHAQELLEKTHSVSRR